MPTGESGLSVWSPKTHRGWPDGILDTKPQCTLSPRRAKLGGNRGLPFALQGFHSSLPRAGMQSRGLSLGPPKVAVLSRSLCQVVPGLSAGLQDPVEAGWAAVLLSSSLARSLLTAVLKGLAHSGRGHQAGPAPTPVLSLRAQVFLVRPLGMVGLALSAQWVPQARGPCYLDSSPSRYSRATS